MSPGTLQVSQWVSDGRDQEPGVLPSVSILWLLPLNVPGCQFQNLRTGVNVVTGLALKAVYGLWITDIRTGEDQVISLISAPDSDTLSILCPPNVLKAGHKCCHPVGIASEGRPVFQKLPLLISLIYSEGVGIKKPAGARENNQFPVFAKETPMATSKQAKQLIASPSHPWQPLEHLSVSSTCRKAASHLRE